MSLLCLRGLNRLTLSLSRSPLPPKLPDFRPYTRMFPKYASLFGGLHGILDLAVAAGSRNHKRISAIALRPELWRPELNSVDGQNPAPL